MLGLPPLADSDLTLTPIKDGVPAGMIFVQGAQIPTKGYEALAKAIERGDLLQHKLDELDAAAHKAQEEAQQRCDRLQQELDEALRAKDDAVAKARTEAELRRIFRLADQDRSGFIDADELLALCQAANPSFTQQKCHDLIDCMDSNHDGKMSPDEFVEVVLKAMEGLSAAAQQKGMKAMRAAG